PPFTPRAADGAIRSREAAVVLAAGPSTARSCLPRFGGISGSRSWEVSHEGSTIFSRTGARAGASVLSLQQNAMRRRRDKFNDELIQGLPSGEVDGEGRKPEGWQSER